MQRHADKDLNGYALIANGPLEILEAGKDGFAPGGFNEAELHNANWVGREFANYADLVGSFGKPWADGLAKITDFIEQLRGTVEKPKNRRRRARWSEVDGEVDVDRVLIGDPMFYRDMHRDEVQGPNTITLLCNIGGRQDVTADEMFWRGAAAVAAADLLEAAGYSVEVVAWSRAEHVFPSGKTDVFVAYRLKECGGTLDIDSLACGLSCWFFRTAVFSARVNGWDRALPRAGCVGGSVHKIGGWDKYLDVSEGTRTISMPVVTDRESAIKAAREILSQLGQPVEFAN
ncbi:MAG: hypothetical protein SGJ20_09515 [Planctomycetota bacterium]|nr:hypothetical protein [Planctomycetota bacterium]